MVGNALNADSYARQVPPSATLVQLVGTPKPNPRKAQQFRDVDLKSGMAAVAAARQAGVRHLVYVSVAHPAPMTHAYIQPRVEVEEAIRTNGLNATILRPWYVLGPGHRWPYLILPGYWIMGLIPSKREAVASSGSDRGFSFGFNRSDQRSSVGKGGSPCPWGGPAWRAPCDRGQQNRFQGVDEGQPRRPLCDGTYKSQKGRSTASSAP